MVFESLVVDVLNRTLGTYVENLDASQLNLGIWGGDVVLKDLDIKATALDDLDLPIKLKYGYLGELKLQIPWKNLYTEPVIATITNLHILAVPNKGVQYNEEKEAKNVAEAKAKELGTLEKARETRRRAAEGRKDDAQDSFVEKMITQVVKNLQVTITDIHIRFEDEYTNRAQPFSAGATLGALRFQTTDENWLPTILKDAVTLIHKAVDLDSISLYWNSSGKLVSRLTDKDSIRAALKGGVAQAGTPVAGFNYVLLPMLISGRLKLNQKPETDGSNFTIPKVDLSVEVKELGLSVAKYQYQNILEFLEAQERFNLSAKYRKYRPNLKEYRGHYKEWWRFAITSILEEEIRRKNRNWSWAHMKAHRELGRAYTKAWVEVLTAKSPARWATDTVKAAEEKMDVFNLNVFRQQAEMELDRRGLTRVADQQGWVGWAKSFWGGAPAEEKPKGKGKAKAKKGDIAAQFSEAMTPEEKAKLFEAIDYQENQPPSSYPKTFVENKLTFLLRKLAISVRDETLNSFDPKTDVVKLELDTVGAQLNHRASAKAIWLNLSMEKLGVWGMKVGKTSAPVMVQMATNTPPLLSVVLETAPLDGSCDTSLKIRAQPLNVIYHAPSINKLADVFKPPESVRLKQLSATAMAKYETVKAQSTTGLAHAVENRSRLSLDIAFQPTLLMIPETGVYTKHSHLLLIDLGALSLRTIKDANTFNFKGNRHEPKDKRLREVMDAAYDNFLIELRSLQMLFSGPKEDWMGARRERGSALHLLQPTGFQLLFRKSSLDDAQIAKIQLLGNLPDLELDISEQRLLSLLRLALSIPTPPPGPPPPSELEELAEPDLKSRAKMKAIMEIDEAALEPEPSGDRKSDSDSESDSDPGALTQVSLELLLILQKIAVNVSRSGADGTSVKPYINLRVERLSAELWMRSMDLKANASVGNLEIQHQEYQSMTDPTKPLFLIGNPAKEDVSRPLLYVKFVQADPKHPYFTSDFKSMEQRVVARFEALEVNLHREALRNIQDFGTSLAASMAEIQEAKAKESTPIAPGRLMKVASRLSLESLAAVKRKVSSTGTVARKAPSPKADESVIKQRLEASLGSILVVMGSAQNGSVMEVEVGGLEADVSLRLASKVAGVRMTRLRIFDPHPGTLHPKILSVQGQEFFSFQFEAYDRSEAEKGRMGVEDVDMGIKFRLNAVRLVFLYAWVGRVLAWVEPFQAAAVEAASQAGEAAQAQAAAAAAAAKEVAAKDIPKIRLDIDIKAPIIIIPQNSRSTEALLADLGRVTLLNAFKSIRNGNRTAILDAIKLELSEFKLARVMLDVKTSEVLAECQLLEPVTFGLSINRNLSFGWFKDRPEVNVKGRMPLIKMSLSEEDFAVIMRTQAQNMGEGAPAKPGPSPSQSGSKTRIADSGPPPADADAPQKTVVETHGSAAPKPIPNDQSADRILFNIHVEGFAASLYMGTSNLNHGIAVRGAENSLGTLSVLDLIVKGAVKENGFIGLNLCLVSFTIDDTRPSGVGVSRLMDKKTATGNMIDVIFSSDQGDMKLDLRLRPFFLAVCPEFLGALLKFQQVPVEDNVRDAAFGTPSSRSPTAAVRVEGTPTSTPAPVEQAGTGTLSVFFALEDPEIIIVEDASRPDQSQALFIKLALEAKYVQGPSGQNIWANLKKMEIYSSYYINRPGAARFQVMPPAAMALMGRMGVEEAKFDVALGEMTFRVSPAVIRLLSSAQAGLALTQAGPEPESTLKKAAREEERLRIWDETGFEDGDYWFIREVLSAEDAVESRELLGEILPTPKKKEIAVIKMDSLIVLLEIGSGAKTIPVILLQTSLSAQANNWGSELSADATLTLQMANYNNVSNSWENMVEPVEKRASGVMEPWELGLSIRDLSAIDISDDYEVGQVQPPKRSVRLAAEEHMEMTISKTCYEMLMTLGDAFAKAYNNVNPPQTKAIPGTSPYVVYNYTGLTVELRSTESLKVEKDVLRLEHYGVAFVSLAGGAESTNSRVRKILAQKTEAAVLFLRLENMNTVREVDVSRAELRSFELPVQSQFGAWRLVVDVASEQGRKIVTLRSILKMHNVMEIPLEVFFLQDTNLERCGQVEAGDTFHVPLPAVYSPSGEFFFKPVLGEDDEEYEATGEPVNWTLFNNKFCDSIVRSGLCRDPDQGFWIHTCGVLEEGCFENSAKRTLGAQCWKLELRAAVSILNVLPVPLKVSAPFTPEFRLAPGAAAPLHAAAPDSLVEFEVLSEPRKWRSSLRILADPPTLAAQSFRSDDDESMDFGIKTTSNHGGQEISIYSPFWMVNATGMDLRYKAGEEQRTYAEHKSDMSGPFFFSFSGKDFFKSKKLQLSVAGADWSDGIPVDAVGNSGRVTSAFKNGPSYDVSVTSQISYSGLTKVITFTPFYLIDNRSKEAIELREVDSTLSPTWLRVKPKSCVGMSPLSKEKRPQICVRYVGEKEESLPFPYTEKYDCFVRISSKRVGIRISTTISESSVVVVVEDFEDGATPALLINHTPFPIKLRQAAPDMPTYTLAASHHRRHFTWDSVMGTRELGWTMGEAKEVRDSLNKDGIGEVAPKKDATVYWTSFLLGPQRTILFSQDIAVVSMAHEAYELERADQEVQLSLQGIGLSIVNNLIGVEVLYLGIVSSGIVWEAKRKRFKAMSNKRNESLEIAFNDYVLRKEAGETPNPHVSLDKITDGKGASGSTTSEARQKKRGIVVDLEEMVFVSPNPGRKIRRTFQEGLSVRYRTSQHLTAIHMKLQHLQIDSQISSCIFPTILAPIPPPKSVAADAVPKPFTELSFIKKNQEHSSLQQIKYLKVLVQEFAVKTDFGTINTIIDTFNRESAPKEKGEDLMAKDMGMTKVDLTALSTAASASGVKIFYDYLHISPLKIHLSFSQGGSASSGKEDAGGAIHSEALNVLLKSVGVTLTEIQDVVFKLAYFEREHVFLTQSQLSGDMTSHYTNQALKQLYVLVLGLDVIGNPFGLIRDLSSGVEDFFYEPLQGAIQGPEEFAEGLALGVKSLFGHALGGAAGAVGRITGTLGKGIAALTLDDEYQKKRQEALNRRPATAREGLAQGGKGLVMGFYDGVTGVIRQPVKGAMEEGFKGFGKGLGKGLIGIVARPVAGVVDFASSSLDAAKKVADVETDVKRLRPPRHIGTDRIIRPYSRSEAEGNLMLKGAEKGRYAETDCYIAHLSLEKSFYLFLTNKRVMVLSKSDVFGNWDVDWDYRWEELGKEPSLTPRGVRFELKQKQKKFLGLGGTSSGKIVTIQDIAAAKVITRKAIEQFNRATEA